MLSINLILSIDGHPKFDILGIRLPYSLGEKKNVHKTFPGFTMSKTDKIQSVGLQLALIVQTVCLWEPFL